MLVKCRVFFRLALLGATLCVIGGCNRAPVPDKALWRARMSGMIRHNPAAGQGLVFVVGENGILSAFSAAQGSNVWTVAGLEQPLTGPVAAGPAVCQATLDGCVHGFSAWTGARLWSIAPFGPLLMKADGRFIAFFNELDGHVYGMDAMDGSLKWDFDPGKGSFVGPVIESNIVYFVKNSVKGDNNRKLLGLAKDTGALQIEIPLEDDVAQVAANGGMLFLAQATGLVWAIETTTQRLLWRRQTGHDITTQIVPRNDGVFYGARDGRLLCLNPATGEERWRFDAGQGALAALAVDGRQAFLAEWRRNWIAIDLETRAALWKVAAPDAGATLPALAETCVVWTLPEGLVLGFLKMSTR